MTTPFDGQIAELMEQYRRQRAELGEMQRAIKEITATAEAAQHAMNVTVDAQGEIVDVSFPTGAYRRMSPAELASVVRDTIRAARADAAAQSQRVLAGFQDADTGLDLGRSDSDWSEMLPEQPPMPKLVRDLLGDSGWQS